MRLWRILGSPRLCVTLTEILTVWSIDDVAAAHEYLDVQEDLEILSIPKPRS